MHVNVQEPNCLAHNRAAPNGGTKMQSGTRTNVRVPLLQVAKQHPKHYHPFSTFAAFQTFCTSHSLVTALCHFKGFSLESKMKEML